MKKRKNPTGQITLPEKYNRYPTELIRFAILHGTSYAEDVLGIFDDTDPKYARVIEKEAIKFLEEGTNESLTPHMSDGANPMFADNPTTPIAEDVFALSPVFAIDGTFFKKIEDTKEREEFQRRLRAAINTLAGIYAITSLKLNKKDYGIEKGASKEQIRNVTLNKYKRVFLVDSISSLLEDLFRINPVSMDQFLNAGLATKDLGNAKTREEFIKKVREQIKKEGFNGESLKKIF